MKYRNTVLKYKKYEGGMDRIGVPASYIFHKKAKKNHWNAHCHWQFASMFSQDDQSFEFGMMSILKKLLTVKRYVAHQDYMLI